MRYSSGLIIYKKYFRKWIFLFFLIIPIHVFSGQSKENFSVQKIVIEWQAGPVTGKMNVLNGDLKKIEIHKGQGKISGNQFKFHSNGIVRIEVALQNIHIHPGSDATIVHVQTNRNPFSFFLRDVRREFPIYIPEYHVVVTESNDNRSYLQIESDIQELGLLTKLQNIEKEPEESFENLQLNIPAICLAPHGWV